MWAPPLLLACLALGAPPDVRNHFLAEGIDRYDAFDYPGALQALTQALDLKSSRRDNAKIHLYIGLIQHRYKLKDDAEASFTKALDYDPNLKLPKGTTKAARVLFTKLRKVKVGEPEGGESRAEEVRKRKRLKPINKEGEEVASNEGALTSSAAVTSVSVHGESAAGEPAEPSNGHGSIDEADDLPSVPSAPEGSKAVDLTGGSVHTPQGSSTPIVGWISIGVGVAAVGTGITLGILSQKNGTAAINEPVGSRSAELHATAVQQRTLAFVSFGVSAVALGLAAVLFLTD
jgi:hypothetical protein